MTANHSRLTLALLLGAITASAQRGTPIPQQLSFAPYHANGIYEVGQTVGWVVTPGPVPPTFSYKWTIRRNNAVVLKEGKLDLSSGKDKIEVTGDQPEMIYVAVEAYADLEGGTTQFAGGNTGRNTGLSLSVLLSRPRNSAFRPRVPTTSIPSGKPNCLPRQRSRSTQYSPRLRPTCLAWK